MTKYTPGSTPEFTPTTKYVRNAYTRGMDDSQEGAAEFDRWLMAYTQQVVDRALEAAKAETAADTWNKTCDRCGLVGPEVAWDSFRKALLCNGCWSEIQREGTR